MQSELSQGKAMTGQLLTPAESYHGRSRIIVRPRKSDHIDRKTF